MKAERVTMAHVVNRELRAKMVPYCVEVTEKSAGVPEVGGVVAEAEKLTVDKAETPVMEPNVRYEKRAAGECVHGRELKHCVYCQITAKKQ